jgi:hypothetical protein
MNVGRMDGRKIGITVLEKYRYGSGKGLVLVGQSKVKLKVFIEHAAIHRSIGLAGSIPPCFRDTHLAWCKFSAKKVGGLWN